MKYRSKERAGFEAYQLCFEGFDCVKAHRWWRELPRWLQDMEKKELFYIEYNRRKKCAYVVNAHGKLEVHENMWIIRNKNGLVFVMDDVLFRESFEAEQQCQAVKDANKDLTIALNEMVYQFSGWAHDETQSKALEQAVETLRRYK